MGLRYSTPTANNNINVFGDGNLAILINGVQHNISSMFDTAVSAVMQKYRSELILVHFTWIVLMAILIFFIIVCLKPESCEHKSKIKKSK